MSAKGERVARRPASVCWIRLAQYWPALIVVVRATGAGVDAHGDIYLGVGDPGGIDKYVRQG